MVLLNKLIVNNVMIGMFMKFVKCLVIKKILFVLNIKSGVKIIVIIVIMVEIFFV